MSMSPPKNDEKSQKRRSQTKYLEVSALVKGLGGSENGHLPGAEVIVDEFDAEALDGFLLETLVLEGQGPEGAARRLGHVLLSSRNKHRKQNNITRSLGAFRGPRGNDLSPGDEGRLRRTQFRLSLILFCCSQPADAFRWPRGTQPSPHWSARTHVTRDRNADWLAKPLASRAL
jgi:hypothetical protein